MFFFVSLDFNIYTVLFLSFIKEKVATIWIYGYISKYIWIYGYWIYGYRDIWIYFDTYRYIVIGIYGYIEIFRIWIYDVG